MQLSGVFLKIENSKRVLDYRNLRESRGFVVDIPFSSPESFKLSASHPLLGTASATIFVERPDTIRQDLVFHLRGKLMEEVIVRGSPMWTNKDTTFFRVDYFKEPDSRKLKDIIENMPGFEVTENGDLLYKKKRVEKITIDGEEVFGDKLRLMLNNFPIHVLETVQAIENQNSNKLLNGLTNEGRVFVNLALKKSKLKAAFGDGTFGLGTGPRYNVAPTLFSLYGKAKLGLVSNWNSLGNGIDWRLENELKDNTTISNQPWTTALPGLQLINNFDPSYYIKNRQRDSRIQITLPGRLKSNTEFSWAEDQQEQLIQSQIILIGDTSIVRRYEITDIRYQPRAMLAKQTFTFQPDSSSEFSSTFSYYQNTNKSNFLSKFYQQTEDFNTATIAQNNWSSYGSSGAFLKRLDSNNAYRVSWHAALNRLPQQFNSQSSDWWQIFNVADPSWNELSLHGTNSFTNVKVEAEWITRVRKRTLRPVLSAEWTNGDVMRETSLETKTAGNKFPIPGLDAHGHFRTFQFQAESKLTTALFGETLEITALAGGYRYTGEVFSPTRQILPKWRVCLSQKRQLPSVGLLDMTLDFSRKPLDVIKLQRLILPLAYNAFYRNAGMVMQNTNFNATLSLSHAWTGLKSINLTTIYDRDFTSSIQSFNFYDLLQLGIDSFVNNPVYRASVSTNVSIPSLWLNSLINFHLAFNSRNFYVQRQSRVFENHLSVYAANFSLRKNWKKKIYLTIEAGATTSEVQDNSDSKSLLQPTITNIVCSVKQLWKVNKVFSPGSKLSFISNNINSSTKAYNLLLDANCLITIPKKVYSFSIEAQNLLNQRAYNSFRNTPYSQSFYSIPLFGRSLIASVRLEF